MPLTVSAVLRQFKYKGTLLADPNPTLSPDEVMAIYAGQFPELTNAVIDDGKTDKGIITYGFSVSAGEKG